MLINFLHRHCLKDGCSINVTNRMRLQDVLEAPPIEKIEILRDMTYLTRGLMGMGEEETK